MVNFYLLIGGCPVWVGRRPAEAAIKYSERYQFKILGSVAWKVKQG